MLPASWEPKRGRAVSRRGSNGLALIVFGALFVLLFAGFAIAQGLTGPSVPSGDIAHVSGAPADAANISEAQLKRGIVLQVSASGEKAPKPGSKKYKEVKAAVTKELIETVWLSAEAENLGIVVTEKQIETELANIKKQNFPTEKSYKEFLKTSHYTQDDVNEKVELTILNKKIGEQVQNEAEPASSAEIQAYYEAEKEAQFSEPTTRDVRVIVNEKKQEVEKAKEELEADSSPAGWKKTAKKRSSDPTTSSKGGLQKAIPEELLQGPLKKAIYGSAKGELIGPTKYQSNYLLTEVVKLNPEKVKTLAEVRSQISQTLTQQKQQEHLTEFASAYQERWTAATVCASGLRGRTLLQLPGIAAARKSARSLQSLLRSESEDAGDGMPGPRRTDETGAARHGHRRQTRRRTVRAAATAGSRPRAPKGPKARKRSKALVPKARPAPAKPERRLKPKLRPKPANSAPRTASSGQ